MEEKNRYTDEELQEFKELILAKLETAKANLQELKAEAFHTNSNGTDDTSPVFKAMEDESTNVQLKEEMLVWLNVSRNISKTLRLLL